MVVLIGVDGSDGSRAALRWARQYSDLVGAHVCVVRAWEYAPTAVLPGGPSLHPRGEVEQVVAAEVAQLLEDELGDAAERVDTLVEPGAPHVAIMHAAAKCHADLVVVGRHGLGSTTKRLLGSVSRHVVQQASCPVAVVPSPLIDRDGPVVVGLDGSANATAALRWAIPAAVAGPTQIVAVHASSVAPLELSMAAVEAMDDEGTALAMEQSRPAIDAGVDVRYVVTTLDARTLINATAEAEKARLVVVGARGAGPIASLLVGSTATYLAEHCDHPLVVVPSPTQ